MTSDDARDDNETAVVWDDVVIVLGVVTASFDVSQKFLVVPASIIVALQHEVVDALVQVFVHTFFQTNIHGSLWGSKRAAITLLEA